MGKIAINDLHGDIADDGERLLVDGVEIVVDRVPVLIEAALFAVLNNVDHRYTEDLVDIQMVVEDAAAEIVDEDIAIAQRSRAAPHFVHETRSKIHRDFLFGEAGLVGAHHVEKDSVLCGVEHAMRILSPMLRALAPSVVFVASGPFGYTLIFNIEEHKVDAHIRRHGRHDASQLQYHRDAAGTIVGTQERPMPIVRIQVVVGPLPRIPMGSQQDALVALRGKGANNIETLHLLPVPKGGQKRLNHHGIAPAMQTLFQIIGTEGVAFGARMAIAESELIADKKECRVSVERGDGDLAIIHRGGCL